MKLESFYLIVRFWRESHCLHRMIMQVQAELKKYIHRLNILKLNKKVDNSEAAYATLKSLLYICVIMTQPI